MASKKDADAPEEVSAIEAILEKPRSGLDASLLARLGPPPKNVKLPPTREEEDELIKKVFEGASSFVSEQPPPAIVEGIRKQVLEREKRAQYDAAHKPMPKRYRTASPPKEAVALRQDSPEDQSSRNKEEEEKDEATLQKELDDLIDLRRRVVDLIERRKTYKEKCEEAAARAAAAARRGSHE